MSREDDATGVGALGYSLGSSGGVRGAAVGVMRSAGTLGRSLVRAGRAISAAPASSGSSADAASEVPDASSCSLSREDDAVGAGALDYSLGSSGGARGAAVGVMRSAGAVGGSLVRAGRAISAAPAGDGSSADMASEVLEASSCSLPRGDDAIGAGALDYSLGSSGGARGAAVGVMRSAGAVGRSLVRAGRAISALLAGDSSSADVASEVLDASSCGLSRGDDAIGAGALDYSLGLSGGARGATVGVMRSAGAVGRSLVRAGRAISASLAGDSSSADVASEVLDASSCSLSRDDDATGAGALGYSLGSSEGARGAAVGVMRSAGAVGKSLVLAGRAISAAPVGDGSSVIAASEVLDASSRSLSHIDDAVVAGALDYSLGSSGGAREAADGVMRLADAVCGSFLFARGAQSARRRQPTAAASTRRARCSTRAAAVCRAAKTRSAPVRSATCMVRVGVRVGRRSA